MAMSHLNQLGTALQAFTTPSQVTELVELVVTKLQNSIDTFTAIDAQRTADDGDGARKRRRKGDSTSSSGTGLQDHDGAVITLACTARLAAEVLTSLPTKIVQHDMLSRIHASVTQLYTETVHPAVVSGFKSSLQSRRTDRAGCEIALAALLHFRIRLMSEVHTDLRPSTQDDKLRVRMLKAVSQAQISQELLVVSVGSKKLFLASFR
jgi:hypothetical protein